MQKSYNYRMYWLSPRLIRRILAWLLFSYLFPFCCNLVLEVKFQTHTYELFCYSENKYLWHFMVSVVHTSARYDKHYKLWTQFQCVHDLYPLLPFHPLSLLLPRKVYLYQCIANRLESIRINQLQHSITFGLGLSCQKTSITLTRNTVKLSSHTTKCWIKSHAHSINKERERAGGQSGIPVTWSWQS